MLTLRNISKRFRRVAALDNFSFAVRAGEVVGLLGENGAGKSTALAIMSGALAPTSGDVLWYGQPCLLSSPGQAAALGIGVVHQHFVLVPQFTVAENCALRANISPNYNRREWEERVSAWAHSLGWLIEPSRKVCELSVGERQRVEILKALYSTGDLTLVARVLLLDEPTANLSPGEAQNLFEVLRQLRQQGCGVVLVSHKLNETLEMCDRVVVIRHGTTVAEQPTAQCNAAQLAELMVGPQQPAVPLASVAPGEMRLRLTNLSRGCLHGVSLDVRAGEIVGLAGVDGNGQAELLDVLSGVHDAEFGSFEIYSTRNADVAGAAFISFIPADRQQQGLILEFDLAENVALHPAARSLRRCGQLDWRAVRGLTRNLLERYSVRGPDTAERAKASELSGGNQQKLVVARALAFDPEIVVAADPTRGLDIAATAFVHNQLRKAAARGVAILLVSSDLDEVLLLSDRVGALYEGALLPNSHLLERGDNRAALGAAIGGENTCLCVGAGAMQ